MKMTKVVFTKDLRKILKYTKMKNVNEYTKMGHDNDSF